MIIFLTSNIFVYCVAFSLIYTWFSNLRLYDREMTDWSVGKHISWLCSMLVFFSMLLRSTIKFLALSRFNSLRKRNVPIGEERGETDIFAGYYYTRNCEFLTCSLHTELHALKRLMQTFKVHSFLSFWLKYSLQSLFLLLKIMFFHVFLSFWRPNIFIILIQNQGVIVIRDITCNSKWFFVRLET